MNHIITFLKEILTRKRKCVYCDGIGRRVKHGEEFECPDCGGSKKIHYIGVDVSWRKLKRNLFD